MTRMRSPRTQGRPPRYRDAWNERDREIRVSTLRTLGHGDIADLLEHDPGEFRSREASGHFDVWGPDEAE